MDPNSFIARAEAQRWIGIAEKLLMGHDLVGSKTFAIRARESDPRLEAADQILAIADTLLAAEKPVVGNNDAQQADYYAILQLVRFVQDTDHIASQYRRLAVLLNPHQNRFPYSDQAFQLVNDAWAVLSNPMRKSMYDAEIDFPPEQQMNNIGFNLEQQQHHHQQQHQEQHNFFSINDLGSDHEQELPEADQPFQIRLERTHQQQQSQHHNFLSQNQSIPVREEDQLFQHHEQEQLFQPQVEPLEVTSTPHQQNRPPPSQPPQAQPHMQPTTPPPPVASPQPPLSWPQASPLSQPEQPQPKQQHHLQPQQQQNAGPVQFPNQDSTNNGEREEETETEAEAEAENVDESPTFWTACPYCFYMYEYQRIYLECTLRCDHCKRAFQAVHISSPPSMAEGQEIYFYCWGYFPIGVSISDLPKHNGAGTNPKWTHFSPLHNPSSNLHNHFNSKAAPKKNQTVNKSSGPRIYIDDITDDIFTDISEPSDDSDVEWDITREKS